MLGCVNVELAWEDFSFLGFISDLSIFHNHNVSLKYQSTTQRNQLRVNSVNNVFSSSLKSLLWFSWL